MLDIKPFILEEKKKIVGNSVIIVWEKEKEITKKLSNYLIFYKLKSAKRTGTLMDTKTFNHIFAKLKADYYQLFIHKYRDKKLLLENIDKYNRLEKIKKYYTEGYYENIENIIIQGGNQITPLLEALALWVDYDLIKEYYKGFDVEKIDKTLWLWSIYYSNYYHIPIGYSYKHFKNGNSEDKNLLSMKKRFNLLRFIWLLYNDEIPLVYKDGVLMHYKSDLFKDLSIYNVDSVETAVKNIIKKLLNKNLNLNDFLNGNYWGYIFDSVIHAFPYVFVLGWTGYGYALNVYKFNPKSMSFESIKNFMVERPFIGSEDYLKKIKFVNVNDISDITGLINNYAKFWVDDEYVYFYISSHPDKIIYKVKRSDVQFLGVDGRKYYFRIFGKHFKLRGVKYHFVGVVTPVEDG